MFFCSLVVDRTEVCNRPTSMGSFLGDPSSGRTRKIKPHSLYKILEGRSKEIVLPGEMWFCHVKPDLYIMFGKVKPDTQLCCKMIIYPDMKTKVFYNEKWLPWMQANINSEKTLVEILKQLHSSNLSEFL